MEVQHYKNHIIDPVCLFRKERAAGKDHDTLTN